MKQKHGGMGYNHSDWSHCFDGEFQSFILPWGMYELHDYKLF